MAKATIEKTNAQPVIKPNIQRMVNCGIGFCGAGISDINHPFSPNSSFPRTASLNCKLITFCPNSAAEGRYNLEQSLNRHPIKNARHYKIFDGDGNILDSFPLAWAISPEKKSAMLVGSGCLSSFSPVYRTFAGIMFERIFRLRENGTTVRTELLAGLTTFLTMAYIIFVQPAVLTGRITGMDTGMDFGAVLTATCLAAALATLIMGLYARYPIAQAPGMGENFFFAITLFAAAKMMIDEQIKAGQIAAGSTTPWQIGLGVVFLSGVLFFGLSMLGVREKLMEAISPSMRHGIAGGIGLFIAFIGLQLSSLVVIVKEPVATLAMNTHFASPDLIVFFFGLLVMCVLQARRVRGAILWGILAGGAWPSL